MVIPGRVEAAYGRRGRCRHRPEQRKTRGGGDSGSGAARPYCSSPPPAVTTPAVVIAAATVAITAAVGSARAVTSLTAVPAATGMLFVPLPLPGLVPTGAHGSPSTPGASPAPASMKVRRGAVTPRE